ncbi:MAG TPA: hypothetical protein VGO55_08795 [Allosphingosinicella sp.]|jgi:hypothetical protein|nr:hypothetical protein [Allosphingosinicella sp.]
MNFYVPDPRLDAQADMLLRLMEELLASHGRAFTGRRIRALIWDDGEEEETILVGAEYNDCEAGEDPVLLILEDAADPALIYVVSLSQVAYEEMPNTVRLDPLWRVVDFDDE